MTTQQLEELRDSLATAHNYASEICATSTERGSTRSYYSGKAEAFIYVIDKLNRIIESEKVGA